MVVDSMPSKPTSEGSVQRYWHLHVRAFEAKRRRRTTLSNDLVGAFKKKPEITGIGPAAREKKKKTSREASCHHTPAKENRHKRKDNSLVILFRRKAKEK
ncbi:hypothetical protein ES288_A07G225400v1 [Gossypium darwinii]|uniref:Uncharacterized protein n=1 Tax=Gossypium darwinii TaxID=34276 RepID=A0A5D2FYE7_GOSDA|nr:hypothetical protein ES288_A07G225400v1 [Gossypium darwinii]